jgi:hypothetical protein
MSSFRALVTAIRDAIGPGVTMTVRHHEEPPSAVFHGTLNGSEYVISVQPTRAATLLDATEEEQA